jgi:hypothetical protein
MTCADRVPSFAGRWALHTLSLATFACSPVAIFSFPFRNSGRPALLGSLDG